jgi:hypothetical protein
MWMRRILSQMFEQADKEFARINEIVRQSIVDEWRSKEQQMDIRKQPPFPHPASSPL